MKKIRAKYPPSEPILVINNMTLPSGQEIPVFDEKILKSSEVKKALQEGKIEIIDDEQTSPTVP
jgi:hypothetical protein